jgi:uncharacterized protein YneR
LLLVVLGVALWLPACSPRPQVEEEDARLVTLLGEPITREDIGEFAPVDEETAEQFRQQLTPENWALWKECMQWRPLRQRIHEELMQWFHEEYNLNVTREEVEVYIRYVLIQPMILHMPDMEVPDMPGEDSHEWSRAVHELTLWKVQNTLYDRYGGRIAVDRGGQWAVALDAYERFLRESEQKGLIEFHEDEFRALFWNCVSLDEFQYPREYAVPDQAEARAVLREYPGTRRLRIIIDRFTQILDEGWADIFNQLDHPPGWPG